MTLEEKITILAMAARYDVSCSSSGSRRSSSGGWGNTLPAGICHSFADDGRCISLLKILLTNICIYDCVYCVNRKSNDIPRALFEINEIVDLTFHFYQRNYIEGLFLSSGVFRSPDYTMELFIQVLKKLRLEKKFNGYIHIKAIPGADEKLLQEAGLYADRMSVNIELPSENSLKKLAPDKKKEAILQPMAFIDQNIQHYQKEKQKTKKILPFVPAGQSTQMIIGASPESDYQIIKLSESLYKKFHLKRVYYSAYVPVNHDKNLPSSPDIPLLRENRLYQTDWLLRFYHFQADEILDPQNPFLDLELDPKENWALRHLDFFPVEINKADYETLLRVPGIGIKSALRILQARKYAVLDFHHLKKMGVVLKRAKYFITCSGRFMEKNLSFFHSPQTIRQKLLASSSSKNKIDWYMDSLFA